MLSGKFIAPDHRGEKHMQSFKKIGIKCSFAYTKQLLFKGGRAPQASHFDTYTIM